MRYIVYSSDGKKTKMFRYDSIKEASDFISDHCEDKATLWDTQFQRWVSGAEILLAAVTPDAKKR